MSKILYRPHRGGLADAKTSIKEFNSEKEFKEYIVAKDKELGYDCSHSNANTLFELNGRYHIYINTNFDFSRCGDFYFVKSFQ